MRTAQAIVDCEFPEWDIFQNFSIFRLVQSSAKRQQRLLGIAAESDEVINRRIKKLAATFRVDEV